MFGYAEFSNVVLAVFAIASTAVSASPNPGPPGSQQCTGNSRFPQLAPSDLDAVQKPLFDSMDNITQQIYGDTFTLKDKNGSLLGPFNMLLYSPTVVTPWVDINLAIGNLLNARERELAILAVLSVTHASYGLYAHTRLSEKAGFTDWQTIDLREGRLTYGLSQREVVTYLLSQEMARMTGPLNSAVYNSAAAVLGRDGMANVIHTTGAFMYTSVMLNAADVCVPPGESI